MLKKIENHLFKKIEVWFLYLLIIILVLLGLLFGVLVDYHKRGGLKYYQISSFAVTLSNSIINGIRFLKNPKMDSQLLEAEENFRFKNQTAGFNIYQNKEIDLLFLLNITDPVSRRHLIKLIDLKNYKTIYEYAPDYDLFRSVDSVNNKGYASMITDNNTFFRSSYLTNNKNIISIYSSASLVKFSPESEQILWFKDDFFYHHNFYVNEEKRYIWAIGCLFDLNVKIEKKYRTKQSFCDDSLVKIDLDSGKTLKSISIPQLMIDHNLHNYLFIGRVYKPSLDPLHINDVEEIKIQTTYGKKGDLLISIGNLNMIMHIDPEKEKILWKFSDGLFHQHDVDVLNSEEIVIFNNNRIITDSDKVFKNNEINLFNFATQKMSSPYDDVLKKYDVKTVTQGLQEITEFGVFVEEQNSGRYLFFDNENGDLIFEYINKNPNNRIYKIHWSRLIKDKTKIQKLREYYQ